MSYNTAAVRKEFPTINQRINGQPLVYLDSAATALKPQSVINTINEHYMHGTSNVHRGIHSLSNKATQEFEEARNKVSKLLNASENEIVYTHGTTESLNIVAQGYRHKIMKGDEIIVTELEHHSNFVPWQMLALETGATLKMAPIDEAGELDLQKFKALLGKNTKLVAITALSNTIGTYLPIKEISKWVHEYGADVVVDAAQAISNMKIDVKNWDCDFLAFSGHKFFGPTGIGILYGKNAKLNELSPTYGGGAMIEKVSFEQTTYLQAPFRFEAGTPHIAGALGLGTAVDFISSLGFSAIHEYEDSLVRYAIDEITRIDGICVLGKQKQRGPILSFVAAGAHAQDIGSILDQEGIAVRTGHHCTQPLLKRLGVTSTVRASFSIYSNQEDVERFAKALKKSIKMLVG